jgi:bifunctional UDP-N-acetylglucosamine pyrophosphorylase/glucosamine-1-phosphate N-acetyltransferase
VVYPNVFVEGKSTIGKNCVIEPGSIIRDSILEDEVEIKAYSHLENAVVRKAAGIGPYGRLRPGADVGSEAKIGNFVEVKKAVLDRGVKVSHLSYVGDAEIGENTNIGCGFITCNYDGAQKHKTKIGKNSFIGSDTQMIAPVELGEGCYVASGSTINQDMPAGSFGIARAKQVTKENMAKRFIKTKS